MKKIIESSKVEDPYNNPSNASEIKNLNLLKKDMEDLLDPKQISNIYECFILNYQEILKELKFKLDYFADDNTNKLFTDKFFPPLLDTCMNYVYRFYIAVSENYSANDDYARFGFHETRDLMKIGREILHIVIESEELGEVCDGKGDLDGGDENIENLENEE